MMTDKEERPTLKGGSSTTYQPPANIMKNKTLEIEQNNPFWTWSS